MKATLFERRKYFDSYGARPAEKLAALPPRGIRYSCPCCGYPTLAGRGTYEICELCWWEDDGQDDADADVVAGGPNDNYSLVEARDNFERFLVMYPPDQDRRVGGPDTEATRALKRALIDEFEKLMASPTAPELDLIWASVRGIERQLYRNLKTSLR
jgi:hypothetical protein